VAYRRDRLGSTPAAADDSAAQQGWNALWNHDYAGAISLYDSYGDTIAVTILRDGSLDVNSCDPNVIDRAKQDIEETINGQRRAPHDQRRLREAPRWRLHRRESWSGDIVGGVNYLPKGTGTDVLGYWRPETARP
jgi:spermidine/putrescine transport system substrate-binding protein